MEEMPGMEMNNSSSSTDMEMMMHMSFYWGKEAIVLFSGWPKQSTSMYILAFFFVTLLAAAIEILSVSPTSKLLPSNNPKLVALAEATVYAVRTAFAYMLMLSVMSFNLGIFIAAVLGHTAGFFLLKIRALAAAANPPETVPKV